MENHGGQQKANAFSTAINRASQATCLAREMKVEIEAQEMIENIPCNLSNGLLRDTCKHRIAEFLEEGRPNSGCAI